MKSCSKLIFFLVGLLLVTFWSGGAEGVEADQMALKFGRGLGKVAISPLEIPKGLGKGVKTAYFLTALGGGFLPMFSVVAVPTGAILGTGYGVLMFGQKAGGGLLDTSTFYLP